MGRRVAAVFLLQRAGWGGGAYKKKNPVRNALEENSELFFQETGGRHTDRAFQSRMPQGKSMNVGWRVAAVFVLQGSGGGGIYREIIGRERD